MAEVKETRPIYRPKKYWYFFHPENPENNYLNKIFNIRIGNKEYTIQVNNGTVKTEYEEVAKFLKQAGYIFIKEEEIKQART